MSRNNKSSDSGIGCILVLMLAVFAMPFVGGYLTVAGEDNRRRMLGVALLILGIIVWIKIGVSV